MPVKGCLYLYSLNCIRVVPDPDLLRIFFGQRYLYTEILRSWYGADTVRIDIGGRLGVMRVNEVWGQYRRIYGTILLLSPRVA